ncbi:MAG: hypothetical protein R2932_43220 [Caldilineaceae bacterium]
MARAGSVENDERLPTIAVDANRTIYLSAEFAGRTMIFGEGSAAITLANRNDLAASFDSFLARYNAALAPVTAQFVTHPERGETMVASH